MQNCVKYNDLTILSIIRGTISLVSRNTHVEVFIIYTQSFCTECVMLWLIKGKSVISVCFGTVIDKNIPKHVNRYFICNFYSLIKKKTTPNEEKLYNGSIFCIMKFLQFQKTFSFLSINEVVYSRACLSYCVTLLTKKYRGCHEKPSSTFKLL